MRSNYLLEVTDSTLGSAFLGVVVTSALGVGLTLLATNLFGSYGFALFVGTPFALGFFSSVLHGLGRPRTAAECVTVGTVSVVIASFALIAFALEGAICIVMALPLTVGLGLLGALVGYAAQRRFDRPGSARALSVVVLLPVLMGAESAEERRPPLRAVTTEVVVDAPPAVVWRHVVSVEPLPEPRELLFRAGIAYPTHATISGTGVGAVRRCTFSTGDFVEPITVWEPGRRLEFRVASQPPPMRELSPWANVHPPHLDGFLRSERGRFELIPLAGGRTLLRGTSWYRNRMWPQPYWGLWADVLMHRIHSRVLRHVERLAEEDAAGRTLRRAQKM
jgi:hypothetical protein